VVGVAQSVELLVVVQAVAGSNPVAHPSGAATFASRSLRSLACGPDLHIELHGYDSVAGECEILVNALETAGYRARHVETNRPVTARSVHEAIPGHVDAQS
jgi:hypothetical protein